MANTESQKRYSKISVIIDDEEDDGSSVTVAVITPNFIATSDGYRVEVEYCEEQTHK